MFCLELSAELAQALANIPNDLHDFSSHDPADSDGHLCDWGVLLDWLLASGWLVRNSPLSETLRAERGPLPQQRCAKAGWSYLSKEE